MAKLKNPLMSFDARGKLGKWLRIVPRHDRPIVEAKAEPPDIKSLAQLSWRHMYQKAVALWTALSAGEKQEWESQARRKRMTGFAWFMSQALRPNPGLYLPLQGGTMQGEIDMAANKLSDVPDPALAQDADTKAARDAAIAAALAGSLHCDIYGYDGANWQTLLVESAAQKNLRVKLYDGANGIATEELHGALLSTDRGLVTSTSIQMWNIDAAVYGITYMAAAGDGKAAHAAALVQGRLYGFNGATWDRLRTYPTGILKVGRAEIGASTLRRTNAGQVKGSSGHLYWITMNPSAGNSVMELSNDLDGSTAVVYDHFHTSRQTHHVVLDPPMPFSTGIYLKTITNMTSIIFCYK